MTKFKPIEATADNVIRLQSALHNADALVQEANNQIGALTSAIQALIAQPDSAGQREQVWQLCRLIQDKAWDAMNCVNASAEEFGANFVSADEGPRFQQLQAAVHAAGASAAH